MSKPNYIRIYGHRGARGEYPENTIEGFKHTFSLQIKAIEFDVLISKDNVPQNPKTPYSVWLNYNKKVKMTALPRFQTPESFLIGYDSMQFILESALS